MHHEAKKAYQSFLRVNPNHPECNFNLGTIYQYLGEFDDAVLLFNRAIRNKKGYMKALKAKIVILKKIKKYD